MYLAYIKDYLGELTQAVQALSYTGITISDPTFRNKKDKQLLYFVTPTFDLSWQKLGKNTLTDRHGYAWNIYHIGMEYGIYHIGIHAHALHVMV